MIEEGAIWAARFSRLWLAPGVCACYAIGIAKNRADRSKKKAHVKMVIYAHTK